MRRFAPGRSILLMGMLAVLIAWTPLAVTAESGTPAATAATGATPAAFQAPKFGIFPIGDYPNSWFTATVEPGASVEMTAGIRNSGDLPVALETYATNAFNPPNGGFEAATADDEPVGPTLWVEYPASSFALQPGEQREQQFTVTVPEGTAPGEYVVALVAQTSDSIEIPGTDLLRQVIRSTISVEITVPGTATSGFDLGTPVATRLGDDWVVDLPITNTGAARLRPQGEIVVTTPDGEEVATSRVEMGSVYGGLSTTVRWVMPGHVPVGDYLVSVELHDEATGESRSEDAIPLTLAEPVAETPEVFRVEQVTVTPNADPVQYADVSATIVNNGPAIPTAKVVLAVRHDGQEVERYPLAEDRALASGETELSQRYIPLGGWQGGEYTFQLIILSVNGETETLLGTIDIDDTIVVP